MRPLHWGFAVLFALLTACDNGQGQNAQTNAGPPPLAEVRLGYFANVTHAQAILGVSSGDFQSALGQTKLSTKVFNAGPELITAINAGRIDIGYVGPGPVLAANATSGGQAIRVISGSAANGVVIVASKDSGIHTLSDLKSKRIATPQLGNTQDVSARHYVTAILHQPDANNVKEVRNSQQAAMMGNDQIDAAWVPEPWGARLINDTGAILIGEEKDLWPDQKFSLTVIVTTPQFLADHPDIVEKILTVHRRWTQRLSADSSQYADQLNDALAALGGKKLPSDVMRSALARTLFTDDPLPQTFSTMEQWSHDLKFIDSAPSLNGLFATDIMNKITSTTATTQP